MSPFETTKKTYSSPKMNSIRFATQGYLLQIISNPGGTVPSIDPDEG